MKLQNRKQKSNIPEFSFRQGGNRDKALNGYM